MNDFNGSEWKKWDLQVHTPFSYLNNQFGNNFDEYVKRLFKSAIANEIAVIGITDYFCIEGYKKIKNDYLEKQQKLEELFDPEEISQIRNITVLPNIEFRLNKIVGTSRINFHIVFSEDVLIKDIEENFLHELDFIYEGNPQGEDEKWKLKLDNLESFGAKLKTEHASFAGDTDLFIGMKCAVVDDVQILNILKNKKTKFEGKFLSIVPADEDLSDINWDSQDHNVRKVIIQKADVIFASNPNTVAWGLGDKHPNQQAFISEFKSLKPCAPGSDAHKYEELFEYNSGKWCWIKAEPAFEGLKQIIHEPRDRVKISSSHPKIPVNVIESISLDVPSDAKVSDGEFDFCFADTEKELNFNPSFNCIIGGRGTGKSSILNLIGLKSVDEEARNSAHKFWNDVVKTNFAPEDCIEIEGGRDFEYIGQNSVEHVAKDTKRLTDFISKRIEVFGGVELEKQKNELNEQLTGLSLLPDFLSQLVVSKKDLFKNGSEKLRLENITKMLEGEEYTQKIEELDTLIKDKEELASGREWLSSLKNNLEEILEEHDKFEKDSEESELNKFELKYNAVLISIAELSQSIDEENFVDEIKNIASIEKNIDFTEKEVEQMLRASGISEEDVLEAKIAKQKISDIKKSISENEKSITSLESKISFSAEDVMSKKDLYENEIKLSLKPLQDHLKDVVDSRNTGEIKNIEVIYSFDEESAWKDIATEFYNFSKKIHQIEEERDNMSLFQDCVFDLKDILDQEEINLEKIEEYEKNPKTRELLLQMLSKDFGKDLFIMIKYRHLSDVEKYKEILVKYDGKFIDEGVSFGQRCTAVIVLVILFGTSPIIIDEPEAHLDPKLITKDLVPILKEIKSKRQVIFATHNANFVINGDAEKIFILQEGDDGKTLIKESTIENVDHRNDLLKLEGGKEAFDKRSSKYKTAKKA